MDAHVFRIFCAELSSFLQGARVQKVYGPAPHSFLFHLYKFGKKYQLYFSYAKQEPYFFLTELHFSQPLQPRSDVMRLRKHCQGSYLGEACVHFSSRRIAFPLLSNKETEYKFLLFTINSGVTLEKELAKDMLEEEVWPSHELIQKEEKELFNEHWKSFSVLTPLLRESCLELTTDEAWSLLLSLHRSSENLYIYVNDLKTPKLLSAWPLSQALQKKKHVEECAVALDADNNLVLQSKADTLFSQDMEEKGIVGRAFPLLHFLEKGGSAYFLLSVISLVQENMYMAREANSAQHRNLAPSLTHEKKSRRLEKKLEDEEARLQNMCALLEDANIIKENLWRMDADEQKSELELRYWEGEQEQIKHIRLDPAKSIRENMLWMFKQAAKGQRGLLFLAERREKMRLQNQEESSLLHMLGGEVIKKDSTGKLGEKNRNSSKANIKSGKAIVAKENSEKNIAVFQSSDGFIILRGKNDAGNNRLVKLGKAHDLWLHTQHGASAHCLIKKHFPAEEVPEKTIQEAACLVGLRSWQRNSPSADIMVSEIRYLKSGKKLASGTALVEKILYTLTVPLDLSLEEKLQ